MPDALTGLGSRAELAALPIPEAGQRAIAFDVCGLIHVNDVCGHGAGDRVLVAVAELLRDFATRHGGRVFRYAGDEFLWLVDDRANTTSRALAGLVLRACAALELASGRPGPKREHVRLNAVILTLRAADALGPVALSERVAECLYREKLRADCDVDLVAAEDASRGAEIGETP